MLNFVAIDFETANAKRNSACSLGITVVTDNKIIGGKTWLIRPKEIDFSPINIKINGIYPEHVLKEPEFPEIWKRVFPHLKGKYIVAHNASFDMSVLRNVLNEYSLECPDIDYFCSVELSKKRWPGLLDHKLSTVSKFLHIPLVHHQAGFDSTACSKIVLEIAKSLECNSLENMFHKLQYSPKKLLEVPITETKKSLSSTSKVTSKAPSKKKKKAKPPSKGIKKIFSLKPEEVVKLIKIAYKEGKEESASSFVEPPPFLKNPEFTAPLIVVIFAICFFIWLFH